MKLDDLCPWLILAIGLITSLAVRQKLRWTALPLAGLFVMVADYRLFWLRVVVMRALAKIGYLDTAVQSPTWHVVWTLLPVACVALLAWGIWTEVRKLPLQPMVDSVSPAPRDT